MRQLSVYTPEIRFRVTGGPFATEQIMGWHITDEEGHTVAVSPDHTFASELNDLYALELAWRKTQAELDTARELLLDAWGRSGFSAFVLPDGSLHPGADATVKELFDYLWPEGKKP